MRVIDEIREHFAAISKFGALEIKSLSKEYPGYVVRIPDGIGVAIKVDEKLEISEKFNSCKFFTCPLGIEEIGSNYLVLCSPFDEYRYEFASLCTEFVEPGEDGKHRINLLEDPYSWWNRWSELVGNTSREQRVYNVIAEMITLEQKIKEDPTTVWTTTKSGSHDIECAEEGYEVKSTIKRYGATITISGQHQLSYQKKLWVYFYRMEESLDGVSINDMKDSLIRLGYEESKIEIELERLGFERGSNIRNKKYKVLEKRKYTVDETFPRIVNESFKNDKLPDAIIRIEYTIDLDGIPYTVW